MAQDKQCYGFFVFVMALFMIQSVSSIFSANYELPHNFAECEKRVQEESIQVSRPIPMKEIINGRLERQVSLKLNAQPPATP